MARARRSTKTGRIAKSIVGERVKGQMPLTVRFNPHVDLPEEVRTRIKNAASWQDMEGLRFPHDAIANPATPYSRAFLIDLPEPITVNGRTIRAVRVKGTALKEHGKPPVKPKMEAFPRDPNEIIVEYSALRGFHHRQPPLKPLGSVLYRSAKREYRNAKKMSGEGITTQTPLGYGRIHDMKFPDGKKQHDVGFVVFGVEDPHDRRADMLFYNPKGSGMSDYLKDQLKERFGTSHPTNSQVAAFFDEFGQAYGTALRDLHDRGYNHEFPNLANVFYRNGEVGFVDLGGARKNRGFARLHVKRLNDLFQAGESLQLHSLHTPTGEKILKSGINPVTSLLKGYFHEAKPEEVEYLDELGHLMLASPHKNLMMASLASAFRGDALGPLIDRAFMAKRKK